MKTVAFHTLGCKVNQYETEAMEELFENRGYSVVDEDTKADIYVINTCTVTNLSDRKSRQYIRKSKKINSDSIIAVVGCYSQVSPDEVAKIGDVDIIIGTTDRMKVVDLCEKVITDKETINIVKNIRTYKEFENINIEDIKSKSRGNIKIQDGCNQFCSYCIIPYARGPIRSRAYDDIIQQSERLALAGFKEVVLTGIHVASYGKDLNYTSLIDVIKGIGKIEGIERIRLSSLEPNLIDDNFMKEVVQVGKVCNHFHLSLQSGSDSVLKRMNRRYSSKLYREKAEIIRSYMPNVGLTTDVIVGFPGETEEEYEDTYQFVEEIGFSRIHVFKYSPRKGTPAATFNNQIDGNIKNLRSEKLIKLGDKLLNKFNYKFINSELEVLFEEKNKKNTRIYEGYTTNYIRVKHIGKELSIGDIKKVKIISVEDDILIGI